MMAINKFSVLIPVYHGTNPNHLEQCLRSIYSQDISPSEIVLVVDNSKDNPELNKVIQNWDHRNNEIQTISIQTKHSLGYALQIGVKEASNEIIFRMDADDICKSSRFESQISILERDPSIDVLGGYIEEFESDPDAPHAVKKVPTNLKEVCRTARFRCPVNHPSVVFKRSSVLDSGGYRDISMVEDYDLWMRMLYNGCKITNAPEVLVSVRADTDLYARRGGLEYLLAEIKLYSILYERDQINVLRYIYNIILRLPVRLAPNQVRKKIYKLFLREDI